MLRIFEKYATELKLCYTTYIGDGDSKAYQTVVAANPYPGKNIIKGEYCRDVQKKGWWEEIRWRREGSTRRL